MQYILTSLINGERYFIDSQSAVFEGNSVSLLFPGVQLTPLQSLEKNYEKLPSIGRKRF
jgi:hypothetical protein